MTRTPPLTPTLMYSTLLYSTPPSNIYTQRPLERLETAYRHDMTLPSNIPEPNGAMVLYLHVALFSGASRTVVAKLFSFLRNGTGFSIFACPTLLIFFLYFFRMNGDAKSSKWTAPIFPSKKHFASLRCRPCLDSVLPHPPPNRNPQNRGGFFLCPVSP